MAPSMLVDLEKLLSIYLNSRKLNSEISARISISCVPNCWLILKKISINKYSDTSVKYQEDFLSEVVNNINLHTLKIKDMFALPSGWAGRGGAGRGD